MHTGRPSDDASPLQQDTVGGGNVKRNDKLQELDSMQSQKPKIKAEWVDLNRLCTCRRGSEAYLGHELQGCWHRGLGVKSGDDTAHGFHTVCSLLIVVDVVVVLAGHPLRLVLIHLGLSHTTTGVK